MALSADGGTALITGDMDSGFPTFDGAVWTFVRSGSAWKVKGPKLLLHDPTLTTSGFGASLAMYVGPGSVWVSRAAASPSSASRPSVSQIVPDSGKGADQVLISGRNLTGTGVVQFGQSVARFTVVSPTKITATVPASATTGKITVVTPHGDAASAKSFTVIG